MSVVIVGGNERMIRQYEQLCKSYSCKAKVYIETDKGIQNFGTPDLVVLFTNTMSHKNASDCLRAGETKEPSRCKKSYKFNGCTEKHFG